MGPVGLVGPVGRGGLLVGCLVGPFSPVGRGGRGAFAATGPVLFV